MVRANHKRDDDDKKNRSTHTYVQLVEIIAKFSTIL